MNKELTKNLIEYFNNYEESAKMFEGGNKTKSQYPCYKSFYAIKDIIKEISKENELYLDMKHSNTEFTTTYSQKFEPTMAIFYNDNSKKCRKGDGIYVHIRYPNNELKEIIMSIELGYMERFGTRANKMYLEGIKNIKKLIPDKYRNTFNSDYEKNIISHNISIKMIDEFEKNLLEMFAIYKSIIKIINEIDGNNYDERYENFIGGISKADLPETTVNTKYFSNNTIFYGIPGSGKSYYIKNELLEDLQIKEYERVTFYPEYTYSDFIGTYKITSDKEEPIKPEAGPFTRMLIKALKNKENNNYALIIEELNRGNAEAIFGDVFQLLDRKNGESEYYINNDFLKECMKIENIEEEIKIPSNLYLIATINTSDQNVFSLDTAFGRRWDYERIDDAFSIEHDKEKYSEKYVKGFENLKWNDFRVDINKAILNPENNIWNREDKQLGLFYISKEQLCDKGQQKDREEDKVARKNFVYNVIRYLWFDVFKNEEERLINALNNAKLIEKEIKICYSFDELAKQIIELSEMN